MTVDNFELLKQFAPAEEDGDTFVYTELLDRTKKAGNNRGRRIKTFYHRSQAELMSQADDIRRWCEQFNVRAYFRPTPRSFKRVGQEYTKHVVNLAMTANWEGIRHGYSHVCGITPSKPRYWLIDCDTPSELEQAETCFAGWDKIKYVVVPTVKGHHILVQPFDMRIWWEFGGLDGAMPQIHKDNPTLLWAER